VKDTKLWFRAKYFGWGWTPITWQGWLLTLIYVVFLVFMIEGAENWIGILFGGVLNILFPVIVVSISFISICYMRGEKPVWRWGRNK